MKKLYTLLSVVAIAFSANSQNLVTNGNLETWTDNNTPASFTMTAGTTTISSGITKEATIKHGGSFSAKHTAGTSGNVRIQNETATIVGGHQYTISYWYLDNDANARCRPWIYWLDSANATITDTASDNAFRPTTYSADNAQWQQFTVTVTAPANAAKLRFEMRTYPFNTGNGSVYYDDLSVVDNTLGLQENAIAGLKVYPNPVSGNNFYIASDASAVKSVAVYDVLGKQVINTQVENEAAINVSNLNAGVYIVKITEEGKTATRKLVIK